MAHTSCLYVPVSLMRPSARPRIRIIKKVVRDSGGRVPSSTTIFSARAIVESRCATMRHVVCRERRILSIASLTWTRSSASDHARHYQPEWHHAPGVQRPRPTSSSPRRARGSLASSAARARSPGAAAARRSGSNDQLHETSISSCVRHPKAISEGGESDDLLSVSNPCGMPHTNSQFASRAAPSICSRVACSFPYAMLDAMVPVKRTGS